MRIMEKMRKMRKKKINNKYWKYIKLNYYKKINYLFI